VKLSLAHRLLRDSCPISTDSYGFLRIYTDPALRHHCCHAQAKTSDYQAILAPPPQLVGVSEFKYRKAGANCSPLQQNRPHRHKRSSFKSSGENRTQHAESFASKAPINSWNKLETGPTGRKTGGRYGDAQ
jgi:hypothetical protein